jgi:hypothetical protein
MLPLVTMAPAVCLSDPAPFGKTEAEYCDNHRVVNTSVI